MKSQKVKTQNCTFSAQLIGYARWTPHLPIFSLGLKNEDERDTLIRQILFKIQDLLSRRYPLRLLRQLRTYWDTTEITENLPRICLEYKYWDNWKLRLCWDSTETLLNSIEISSAWFSWEWFCNSYDSIQLKLKNWEHNKKSKLGLVLCFACMEGQHSFAF